MYKLLYSSRSASMVIYWLYIVLTQPVAQILPDFVTNQRKSVKNRCLAGRGVLPRLAALARSGSGPRLFYQRALQPESSVMK